MPHTNEEQEKEWREWKNNFCQHISDWSYYSADDELEKMREILLQEARAQERKEVVERIKEMLETKGKVVRVAEAVGKEPTNHGPISMARIDGYRVALSDLLPFLETPEKEL